VLVELPAGLWTIQADATQLHQVLLNLALNARDAMPDGGQLVFGGTNLEIDAGLAALHPGARPGPHVVLSVADTGVGIASEHLDRIFEPFFSTKEVGKGTGLGLSTVHAIVREHGGFISVHSKPGAGSTFQVHLPAVPGLDTPVSKTDSATDKRGDGQTILVIEDEAALRDLTRHTLERHGYVVLTASDGAEGVALFAQNRDQVALVLTDMAMPVMDGTATILALHRIEPRLPIIATSGHDAGGRLSRGLQREIRHFLPKPYPPEPLLAAVRASLPATTSL
jgi:CheY-like chemotaxis protein